MEKSLMNYYYSSLHGRDRHRRGITAVVVLVLLPVLVGMAALTVDVGRLTNTKIELQNTADAAALAATQDLAGADPNLAVQQAQATAVQFIGLNPLWNNQPVSSYEIVFGRAELDANTGGVAFVPNAQPANAIDVTVHYQLPYTFAHIFGLSSKLVSARSTSAIGARDIMFVLDVSCSMSDLSDPTELTDDLTALGIPIVGGGGTTICHVPYGLAANEITIAVAPAVVAAHLAHGDALGACAVDTLDCAGEAFGGGDSGGGGGHGGGHGGGGGGGGDSGH